MVAPSPPGGSKGLVIGLVRQGCGTSGQVCPGLDGYAVGGATGPARRSLAAGPIAVAVDVCRTSASRRSQERAGSGTGGPRSPVDARSAAHRR
jgi:hypothetical protein